MIYRPFRPCNRVAVNRCVATGFNLWDYEVISDHRPRENVKQCGNRFSDEMLDAMLFGFKFGFVLESDGLLLFPYSWEKEPKNAAADEEKAKNRFHFAKIFQTPPSGRRTGKIF